MIKKEVFEWIRTKYRKKEEFAGDFARFGRVQISLDPPKQL